MASVAGESGFPGLGWGYPYPWQDVGFFAPRFFPNRVVTSFVGQALLDAYETLHETRFLDAAREVVRFLLEAPKTLFEDDDRRCVSYVPDEKIDWIVMDVSVLVGALAARLGAIVGDERLVTEGGRLVRYVVSKQTDEGAWFYAEPPSASHITHDNYHTGFILDAILNYGNASGSDEFEKAYQRGIEFYERRLFEPDGSARFMSDRHYPIDIHGCAQGVITFSLRQQHDGTGAEMAAKVLDWTIANMWDPKSRVVLLPEAAARTGRASASSVGARLGCRGRSPVTSRRAERRDEGISAVASSRSTRAAAGSNGSTPACSARPRTVCASGCGACCPRPPGRIVDILDAGCGQGVFSFELAKAHPEAKLRRRRHGTHARRHARTRSRAGPDLRNCRFDVGDVTKLDYDGEFDLVVSVDNLEHVEDDVTAIRGLMRALRPGGRAVVHVPGYERRWLMFGRRVNFDVPGHVRPGYRTNELVERLQRAGFEISSCQSTYGGIETFTNNISYLITGADQKRKGVYALVFPILLAVSWLGQWSKPRWGAGVLAVAHRPVDIGTTAARADASSESARST